MGRVGSRSRGAAGSLYRVPAVHRWAADPARGARPMQLRTRSRTSPTPGPTSGSTSVLSDFEHENAPIVLLDAGHERAQDARAVRRSMCGRDAGFWLSGLPSVAAAKIPAAGVREAVAGAAPGRRRAVGRVAPVAAALEPAAAARRAEAAAVVVEARAASGAVAARAWAAGRAHRVIRAPTLRRVSK